jgi:ubiquinone biosynthesis protein
MAEKDQAWRSERGYETASSQTTINQLSTIQRDSISQRLLDSFLRQLLDEQFFHADPHAGNILVANLEQDHPSLWLIDYGMMGRIDDREALLYGRFIYHVLRDDTDGMVDIVCRFSAMNADYDTATTAPNCDASLKRSMPLHKTARQLDARAMTVNLPYPEK